MNKIAMICAFGLGVAAFAPAAPADSLEGLGGYWTGTGSVSLTNGKKERVKCSVVYKVTDNAKQIRQTLRCASQDYSINALAELTLKGAQVTGRYTGNAFLLSIQGGNFTAAMNVDLSDCKQSISISPQGLEVNSISLGLAKC
jgi:hypothetical protein